MRLEYSARFFRRLGEIASHIAQDDPDAARRTVLRIRQGAEGLKASPSMGRPGRVDGTRELVVTGTPYLVPYRVKGDRVQIITVMHGAQRWPERFP